MLKTQLRRRRRYLKSHIRVHCVDQLLERFLQITSSSHYTIHVASDNMITDRCSQPDARHNFRYAGCSPVENVVIYVEYEEELKGLSGATGLLSHLSSFISLTELENTVIRRSFHLLRWRFISAPFLDHMPKNIT